MGNSGASGGGTFAQGSIGEYTRPAGSLAETMTRLGGDFVSHVPSSGILTGTALVLDAGTVVNHGTFICDASSTSLTDAWFALYDHNANLLGTTNDLGSTAWTAGTAQTLQFSSPITAGYTGLYYLCFVLNGTGLPGLRAIPTGTNSTFSVSPIVAWFDNTHTGLTTPSTAPATAVQSLAGNAYYGYVS